MRLNRTALWTSAALIGLAVIAIPAAADQQILDDLIVDGSACIGFDCVNGESFGFDTLRLKENNLRVKFQDTSSSASFPTNDWQLTANDSSNGGAEKFSIDDITGGRTPFTIEASAPSHSLYVDDDGRIGLGTSTPVVELHVVDGDTPTLRLQQDGSSGFTPQTWDVAGNETNFFVRDVTNGSKLAFRIRPGAPTSSIDVQADGDIGIGTSSAADKFHIENTSSDDTDDFLVTSDGQLVIGGNNAGGLPTLMKLVNSDASVGSGAVRFVLEDSDARQWSMSANPANDVFEINNIGLPGVEVSIDEDGDITANGVALTSSRESKQDFEPIDQRSILETLVQLPVTSWTFKDDKHAIRHVGPMAEDYQAAFGYGGSSKTISLTDTNGIAIAAIQGLNEVVWEKDGEIKALSERIEQLEALVNTLVGGNH